MDLAANTITSQVKPQTINLEHNTKLTNTQVKQKHEILQAVKHGNLSLRVISNEQEKNYLQQKNKSPRPVYFIQEGIPVKMRATNNTIGIINPQILVSYKKNACTMQLMNNNTELDDLEVKCLPNQTELQKKMAEQHSRLWDVYADFTSGHLKADGTFKLPMLRQNFNGSNQFLLEHSEMLTTSYDHSQIKCYCIAKDDLINKITDIKKEKQALEATLGVDPLPLVVYCEKNGSIEVYFDEELSTGNQLALNENKLEDFALSLNLSVNSLKELLNMLPLPLKSQVLNTNKLEIISDVVNRKRELIKIVTNPECYTKERFLEIKNSGFPLQEKFLYNGRYRTLLDIFIDTEISTYYSNLLNRMVYTGSNESLELFIELLKSGVTIGDYSRNKALGAYTKLTICKYMKAMDLSYDGSDVHTLKWIGPAWVTNPFFILEFANRCKKATDAELQENFYLYLVKPFQAYVPFDSYKDKILALMHYGTPDSKTLEKIRIKIQHTSPIGMKKSLGNKSADFYIQWINELWQTKEQDSFYQQWHDFIQDAEAEIAYLRKTLGLQYLTPNKLSAAKETTTDLQFLINAFNKPPLMHNPQDNDETIFKILQHYYRRPGSARIIRSLGYSKLPSIWKPLHACTHVLRARNNGIWYMELLEKFNLLSFSADEKTLLALAIIYHDSAAEDVRKEIEEIDSASYFKRDLIGKYPSQLLNDIATALEAKENDIHGNDDSLLPTNVRRYLHILRFADRMDIIRCTGIEADFPKFNNPGKNLEYELPTEFNANLLDIPLDLVAEFSVSSEHKTAFQRNLEAAMHGAADLVQITDSSNLDKRAKNYVDSYQLQVHERNIKDKFETTKFPVSKMHDFIDDNVRRKIASLAEIKTCTTADHQHCRSDSNNGITRGIHNSYHDLSQVRIPANMTLLEKMQCEHDLTVLSKDTQQAIESEVARLKREGIALSLGTLTQKTLKSTAAQKILSQRGVSVIKQQKQQGYDYKTATAKFVDILVPEYP